MTTRAQLIGMVLGIMGVVPVGQDPSSEDYALVDGAIDGKILDLRQRKIIEIYDLTEFEDAYAEWLAWVIAQRVAPYFGTSTDATAVLYAESMLRQHRGPTWFHQPVQVDYY